MEIVYTFNSTHAAISAERLLSNENVPIKVMPVPSSIKAGCGLCLRVSPELTNNVEQLLEKNSIEYLSVYQMSDNNFKFIK